MARHPHEGPAARMVALAVVVIVHAAGLAWLLEHAPDIATRPEPQPIVVQLLTAPSAPKSAPIESVAPAPKPEPKRPPTRSPKLARSATRAPARIPPPREQEPAPASAERTLSTAPAQVETPIPPASRPTPPVTGQATSPPATTTGPVARPAVAASVETPARFDAAYLRNPPPRYPPLARRLGEQGRIVLRVRVDASGSPASVEIIEGSGSPRLDTAARQTVSNWRFTPAMRGTTPIDSWVQVPIVFKLEN